MNLNDYTQSLNKPNTVSFTGVVYDWVEPALHQNFER